MEKIACPQEDLYGHQGVNRNVRVFGGPIAVLVIGCSWHPCVWMCLGGWIDLTALELEMGDI